MKKTDSVVDLSRINLVLSLRMMHQQTMLVSVFFYTSIACKEDLSAAGEIIEGVWIRKWQAHSIRQAGS